MKREEALIAAKNTCHMLGMHCKDMELSDCEKSGVLILTLSLMLEVLVQHGKNEEEERAFCETAMICKSFLVEKAWDLLSE